MTSLLRCRVFKSDLIVLLRLQPTLTFLHLISDDDSDKAEIDCEFHFDELKSLQDTTFRKFSSLTTFVVMKLL